MKGASGHHQPWAQQMCLVLLTALLLRFKEPVETRMVLHMFVQLPVLFAIGWLALDRREPKWLASMNSQGLLGLTVVSAVAAVWMIPIALDMALMSGGVALAKMVSWIAAGALARDSWRRMAAELKCFLLGNLAWMFISVGMLYQTYERRLCVNYLVDDQLLSGRVLVGVGALSGAWACWLVLRATQRDEAPRREGNLYVQKDSACTHTAQVGRTR